jgi:hypothetical protein
MENPIPKDQNPKKSQIPNDKWGLVGLATELGYIIALPLLAFALIGKYLDGKLHTSPWLTLVGIIMAITLTTVWLTNKLKKYIK